MTVFSPAAVQRMYFVIAGLLFLNYSVFMLGYFFLPDYNLQYKYFIRPLHILVLPGIVILAAAFKEIKGHPVFQLIILYMLYMLLSGLWSTPFDLYLFGQRLANAIYILIFIVLTHLLRTRYPVGFDRFLRFSVLFAAVAAIVSMVVFYTGYPHLTARVRGLGSLTNVNEFANVYGVYALLAMSFSLTATAIGKRALYLFPVVAIIVFIWFGQSRMALISLVFALLFMGIESGRRVKIRYIALVVFSTAGALLLAFPDLVEYAIARGDTHRLEIWGTFLRDVAQAPIFGQGLITEVEYIIADDNFHSPHNAYIQALWHGGIIGLGLLLLLMASAFWQAWRLGNESGDYVVLSMLLFAAGVMFAAVDMLINRPRDQWMLFWFPLALLISYQTTGRQVERAGSRAMA